MILYYTICIKFYFINFLLNVWIEIELDQISILYSWKFMEKV